MARVGDVPVNALALTLMLGTASFPIAAENVRVTVPMPAVRVPAAVTMFPVPIVDRASRAESMEATSVAFVAFHGMLAVT